MNKIPKKFKFLLLGTLFLIMLISVVPNRSLALNIGSTTNTAPRTVISSRATLTTDTFTGSVAAHEVDYFAINAAPGLMSLSVTWGNSYDIDCYICTSQDYTSYLARGYTTNKPETCSYNIKTAGTYYIAVRMYTYYASSTSYTATVNYYVEGGDTTNPTVSITTPANGATISDTVTITASASDNVGVSKVQCNIDGGSWTDDTSSPYSWTWDTTTIDDGNHVINTRAYDAAGNYADDSISVTVENTQSSTELIEEQYSGAVAGYEIDYFELSDVQPGLMSLSVSWSGSNDIDCYICTSQDYTSYLARGYTTSNPETCSYTIQTAGTYYLGVRMYTSSASSTSYVATVSYYVISGGDHTVPTVSITAPTDSATVQDTISIQATASDNVGVSKVSYQINGGAWIDDTTSPYSWSWDSTTVSDGSYTITVRAYDAAGNYADDSVNVNVDNVQGSTGKYALVVGISDYKAINDLSYCDEDATDWYNYLISIGYESANIIVLGDGHTANYPKYDGIANEANIKYYLNWLTTKEGEIAYITSGHGSGDGSGSSYICAWDCSSGEDGEDGDLYDTEVAGILQNAIADDMFVFIDHCYSGGFGPDLLNMANSANLYCTTTCTENGYGYDDSDHQNGMWTYYFVEYTLINHFGSSSGTYMEDAFAYASAAYPKSGGDTPQEFDGNSGSYFTL